MLKVSQKTEYAMRAMTELAVRADTEGDGLVPARALAEAQHIPLRFLEQQLGALHKAGLVESFRGAGGGCRLSRPAADIRNAAQEPHPAPRAPVRAKRKAKASA